MNIFERISKAINQMNLKQNKLAEELNISPSATSRIIKGQTKPSLDTISNLCKLCKSHNISIEWLMTGEEQNKSNPEDENINLLIKSYKKADERGKETILETARREAERNSQQEKLSTSRTG